MLSPRAAALLFGCLGTLAIWVSPSQVYAQGEPVVTGIVGVGTGVEGADPGIGAVQWQRVVIKIGTSSLTDDQGRIFPPKLWAVARGARLLVPAKDQFWGDRTAWIMDPAGHVWTVATRIEEPPEEGRQARWSRMLADREPPRGAPAT